MAAGGFIVSLRIVIWLLMKALFDEDASMDALNSSCRQAINNFRIGCNLGNLSFKSKDIEQNLQSG